MAPTMYGFGLFFYGENSHTQICVESVPLTSTCHLGKKLPQADLSRGLLKYTPTPCVSIHNKRGAHGEALKFGDTLASSVHEISFSAFRLKLVQYSTA